jgi:hypothetical protein
MFEIQVPICVHFSFPFLIPVPTHSFSFFSRFSAQAADPDSPSSRSELLISMKQLRLLAASANVGDAALLTALRRVRCRDRGVGLYQSLSAALDPEYQGHLVSLILRSIEILYYPLANKSVITLVSGITQKPLKDG